jgi:excisionase family DNA binding protein
MQPTNHIGQETVQLLRVSDVARRLSVSHGQAYRLINLGYLPAVAIGPRCLRVPEAAILALIARAWPAEPSASVTAGRQAEPRRHTGNRA